MAKAPSMAEIQAAAHQLSGGEETQVKSNVLTMPNLNIANFQEAFRYIANVVLNVLAMAGIVLTIVGLSIVGDRVYLSYTDTGSSKFEEFLKKQGYEQEALAYRQQQKACDDESGTLELCKGASWMYRHPEIIAWPSNNPESRPALAELPRKEYR